MDDGTGTCRCVFPRNGTMVPGSMVTGITEREEIPDCESRGKHKQEIVLYTLHNYNNNLQCFKCVTTFEMDRTTSFVMASCLLIVILVPGAVASMET